MKNNNVPAFSGGREPVHLLADYLIVGVKYNRPFIG